MNESEDVNMADYLSLRVNPDLKEDFYKFCRSKGLTAGKVIKFFAKQFTKTGIIPFSLDEDRSYTDEGLVRISIHMDDDTRQGFATACSEYGLPMSVIVRGYMDFCVRNNHFPEECTTK